MHSDERLLVGSLSVIREKQVEQDYVEGFGIASKALFFSVFHFFRAMHVVHRALERSGAEYVAERAKKSDETRWLNLPLMAAKTCCPVYSRSSAFCSLQFTSVTVIN